jgi:hypothetical protein
MGRDDHQLRRFALLLITIVLCVAVQGITDPGRLQSIVVAVLLGAGVVLAVAIARVRRELMIAAVIFAVLGVAVSVIRAFTDLLGAGEEQLMNALLVACGPPAVALGVVRELRSTGAVHVEAVMGVLSQYMLIGMLFAFVYGAIDQFSGEPYFNNGVAASVSNCIYYSFITLATVGYGDITAHTNLGHTLAVFEALIGQIYLVTVVSLIVSNLGPRQRS